MGNMHKLENELSPPVVKTRRHKHWTQQDIDKLTKLYPAASWEELTTEFPGRARAGITAKANALGLRRQRSENRDSSKRTWAAWTEAEDSLLRKIYGEAGIKDLDATFENHSLAAIYKRASTLGLRRENRWAEDEETFLRENYEKMGDSELKIHLNRKSMSEIRRHAKEMGLRRSASHWTPEEDEIVRKEYPSAKGVELMQMLPGRTKTAITLRAIKLGVPKVSVWRPEEDELLKKLYPRTSMGEILTQIPRHTEMAIRARVFSLGLKKAGRHARMSARK